MIRGTLMDDHYPKFKNDSGLPEIFVGVKEFTCVGQTPPHDHPHIYHAMGDEDFIYCLYCNTKFIHRADLKPDETDPPGNYYGAINES